MDVLRGKRVFITGATGFIGSNLSRELIRHGALIHALVRPSSNLWRLKDILAQITIHHADITNEDAISRIVNTIKPQLVIHSAFSTGHPNDHAGRQRMIETGLYGTTNLLEALLGSRVERIVAFGSSMGYGAQDGPLSESAPISPTSFRGEVKAAGTQLCRQYAQQHGLKILVLRPFTVYGIWESPPRFIPTAILAALRGQTIHLTPPGYRHDFLFIEDIVEASKLACLSDLSEFEIINVGTSQEWTNEEVVEILQSVSGHKLNRSVGTYPPRPWDTAHWVADINKAKRLLGWRPKYTLQQGLEKTFTWFRQNLHLYDAPPMAKSAGAEWPGKDTLNHV
jgi:nucleoside-diphosphate-sugar epimerase